MNGRNSASMQRLGSTKVCYTLLLALAVIENSGDASAAEAYTTLRHQQRRLSTWVRDCMRSSERTTQLSIYSPQGPGLFCALYQGTLLFMTFGARPLCPTRALKLSQLCPSCMSIFEGHRVEKEAGEDPARQVLDQSLQDLERAAQEGCHLCHLLLESLTKTERQNLEGCEKIAYGYWQHGLGDGIAFDFYYPVPGRGSTEYLTKSILVQPEEETLGRSHNHKSWTSPSSDCQASHELARQWIFTCEGTHRNCNALRRIQTPKKLPTRLVDLGDDRNYLNPRLCITEGLPLDTTYMTLSHCWGVQTPLQLRKDNIEPFTEGIQLSQVPKSFRDALKVAAKLKVRYLWIDSLCIIQDSTEDWQHEASLMSDVYTNSWCNIAATKALDGRDGCFAERTLLDISQCVIEARWNSHPSQTYVCWIPDIWDYAVDSQKLLQRAGVTQEIVLSPRVLHFSEHQILWECLELRACETFPSGIPRDKSTKLSSDTYSLRHDLIKYDDPMRQRLALWCCFLQGYTRCSLTFPEKDKLVAISGLAGKLGSGDDYCAGLWKQDLAGQLMWFIAIDERPSTKAPERNPRAPSWSWASVNSPVYMGIISMGPDVTTLIKIVSIDLELETQDPFGQVVGGCFQIEGPLIQTTLRCCTPDDRTEYGKRHWLGDSLASITPDVENFEYGSEVRCLPIRWVSNEDPIVSGLLVEPTHKKKGEYRRIGRFAVAPFNVEAQSVDNFLARRQFQLPAPEWEECLGQDSEDKAYQYRFSLV